MRAQDIKIVREVVETPCINVCVIDATSKLCSGCGRTSAEIGGWLDMSPAERRAVMEALPGRKRG